MTSKPPGNNLQKQQPVTLPPPPSTQPTSKPATPKSSGHQLIKEQQLQGRKGTFSFEELAAKLQGLKMPAVIKTTADHGEMTSSKDQNINQQSNCSLNNQRHCTITVAELEKMQSPNNTKPEEEQEQQYEVLEENKSANSNTTCTSNEQKEPVEIIDYDELTEEKLESIMRFCLDDDGNDGDGTPENGEREERVLLRDLKVSKTMKDQNHDLTP